MTDFSRRDLLKATASLALTTGTAIPLFAADPYEDAVLVDGSPGKLSEGAFTIAVLPDTQHYSEKHPETFLAQTQWLIENQASRNIAYVLHLGDITNHNSPEEWQNADRAMQVLEGKIPYAMVPGNHDYSSRGSCSDRTTLLNDYFPLSRYKQQPTFGGTYDKESDRTENTYHTFTAGGRKFLVLGLEFGPRSDVIRWANEVVASFPDHKAILITHAYMYFDDTRYDWTKFGTMQTWNPHNYPLAKGNDDVNDGQELWDKLISRHDSFFMTLNGHVLRDGLGKLTSAGPSGKSVHQMLVNFQMRPKGGDGWLRLLEFSADQNSIQVRDYSPTRKQLNQSIQNRFSLDLA